MFRAKVFESIAKEACPDAGISLKDGLPVVDEYADVTLYGTSPKNYDRELCRFLFDVYLDADWRVMRARDALKAAGIRCHTRVADMFMAKGHGIASGVCVAHAVLADVDSRAVQIDHGVFLTAPWLKEGESALDDEDMQESVRVVTEALHGPQIARVFLALPVHLREAVDILPPFGLPPAKPFVQHACGVRLATDSPEALSKAVIHLKGAYL